MTDPHGVREKKNHMVFALLSKPVQRQRWGDHQEHPVLNWGDLFFDLFYVAAAYNLSTIIRESPSSEGVLYFTACFWGVYNLWWDRTRYDARFYAGDDLLHHCMEVICLCLLATAVLHIRPVEMLSNPKEYNEMFVLSLCLTLGKFMAMVRYLELLLWVDGQPVAKVCARRESLTMTPTLLFYVAATIYSGLQYYGSNDSTTNFSNFTEVVKGGDRFLASDTSSPYSYNANSSKTDIPVFLLLGGELVYIVVLIVLMLTLPSGGRHKEVTVPLNLDFTIHRYGEWTMLMLGESILSLLIVEVIEGTDYYVTFYSGILSVMLLQLLHFRSQPSHANDHAMRRSKEAGVTFSILMMIYSSALVLLGVSYKMLLYEYVYESDEEGRFLFEVPRWLAGGGGALVYTTDDRQQRIAHIFCGSMAIIWFCSDAMILVHRGINANVCRCTNTLIMKVVGTLFVVVRVGLIAGIATLSQFETDPENIALFGLSGIFFQLMLRILSSLIFPDERVHDAMELPVKGAEDTVAQIDTEEIK